MKRLTKISIIGAGALVLIGTLSGCSHFRTPEDRAQKMVERVTDKLELTEVQQGKLETFKDKMMTSRKNMKQRFGESKEEFKALFDASTIDQKQTLSLVSSHTQYMNEQAPVIIATFANFYDSLDLKQQADIREFMSDYDEHNCRWGSHRFFGHN